MFGECHIVFSCLVEIIISIQFRIFMFMNCNMNYFEEFWKKITPALAINADTGISVLEYYPQNFSSLCF